MMRQRKKLDSYRMLARALAELLDRPWSLVIVGDGPARGEVEAAFAPLGRGRVHFLGARPAPDMPRLYGACDLYVWPGVEEAFGLAFLEAQATARPALAQRTRGIPSVVEDGGGGLLTPPGDLAAFVAALRTLLADGVLRESLGARGAAIVDSRHTIERAGAILARELGEVCA
jgi:glycosyltransferase involved in cell wall biosynthesis